MFRRCISILLTATLLANAELLRAEQFPIGGRTILGPTLGPKLFKQCSRKTPDLASKFWLPSSADIIELETNLISFLDALEKNGRRIPPKEHSYHRQYVGFERNGERVIYGNFYPAKYFDVSSYETREPVIICDGGPAYWGIVYRIKSKDFIDLQFNGGF